MFVVKREDGKEQLSDEEFYKKYGEEIDPMFFRGAYSKHLVTIDKKKVEITEI